MPRLEVLKMVNWAFRKEKNLFFLLLSSFSLLCPFFFLPLFHPFPSFSSLSPICFFFSLSFSSFFLSFFCLLPFTLFFLFFSHSLITSYFLLFLNFFHSLSSASSFTSSFFLRVPHYIHNFSSCFFPLSSFPFFILSMICSLSSIFFQSFFILHLFFFNITSLLFLPLSILLPSQFSFPSSLDNTDGNENLFTLKGSLISWSLARG